MINSIKPVGVDKNEAINAYRKSKLYPIKKEKKEVLVRKDNHPTKGQNIETV